MRNQIKYLVFCTVFLMFSINLVSAEIFSTIAMQGLSFVNPQVGSLVSNIVCIANPISCVSGKVVGMVQSKVIEALAKQSPEAAQAIMAYNQVKGYIDQGAQITNELKLDKEGQIQEGTIKFNEKEGHFGNLVGKDIEQKDIFGKEIEFEKKEGISTITFTGENSYINIKGNVFNNIKKEDENTNSYLKLDEQGGIKEADLTTNEKGGTYVIGKDWISVPPNSRVIYKEGKININAPENSEFKNLPSLISDADSNIKSNIIEISGENIKFPNGNVLQKGEIISKDGKTYISGSGAEIDNLKFSHTDNNFNERVYFDGRQHADAGEDYISLNPDEKNMYVLSKDKSIGYLDFNEGNPFIKVGAGESFYLGTNDKEHNLELGISNPVGKIPELSVKSLSGAANIFNGKYLVYSYEKNLGITTNEEKTNAVPMDIKFQDNTLLPKGKALLIDKDNSYTLIRESNPLFNQYTSLDYQQVSLTDSQKLLIDKIQKETPWIKYNGIERLPLAQLQEYDDEVSQMPDSLKKATTSVNFKTDQQLGASGRVDSQGSVNLAYDNIKLSPETISHEFSHKLDYSITSKNPLSEDILYKELSDELNSILKKNKISLSINPDSITEGKMGAISLDASILREIDGLPKNVQNDIKNTIEDFETFIPGKTSRFDIDWSNIQREGNGKYSFPSGSELSKGFFRTAWSDGKNDPRNGFLNAYSSTDITEDIATYVEKVSKDPELFAPLINPESPKYDSRYQQKLDLLQKYGFISLEQYQQVLKMAGISK